MNARPNDGVRTFVITVGGSGFAPFASGSWGSLAALLPYALLWWLAALAGSRVLLEAATILVVVLSCIPAIQWGPWAIQRFGRKDPKQFVLDEFAGQWVALLWMPMALQADWWTFAWLIGGQFVLFRVLDVLKPPPARQIDQRWTAGWGILCDDLVSGAYANLVGQVIWRLTPMAGWIGVVTA